MHLEGPWRSGINLVEVRFKTYFSRNNFLGQRIFLAYTSLQRVMKSNQMSEESQKILAEWVMVTGEGRGGEGMRDQKFKDC